jgi:hypothetical protein
MALKGRAPKREEQEEALSLQRGEEEQPEVPEKG